MAIRTRPLCVAALLAGVATVLVSCSSSTLSKEECRTVDWRTIGYEDGVAGRSGERIGEHRRACAEYGVAPDLNAYRAGREEGLREYCQPHNGYRAGVSGAPYYDSCPAELAPAFVTAYQSGRELYVRERRVADADAAIAYRRREVARLESRIADRAITAITDEATPAERTDAVLDTKHAAERIGRLKSEIAKLERDRARYQQELESYRSTVASVP